MTCVLSLTFSPSRSRSGATTLRLPWLSPSLAPPPACAQTRRTVLARSPLLPCSHRRETADTPSVGRSVTASAPSPPPHRAPSVALPLALPATVIPRAGWRLLDGPGWPPWPPSAPSVRTDAWVGTRPYVTSPRPLHSAPPVVERSMLHGRICCHVAAAREGGVLLRSTGPHRVMLVVIIPAACLQRPPRPS